MFISFHITFFAGQACFMFPKEMGANIFFCHMAKK
jgi:hypothetical protein